MIMDVGKNRLIQKDIERNKQNPVGSVEMELKGISYLYESKEMQYVNKEIEYVNKEMQYVNEEMQYVNEEMQFNHQEM